MHRFYRILLCLLWLPVSSGSGADTLSPKRVVSVNLCTDQLLLMLADPDQIASISHLARDPESSFMAVQANAFPINHARLEELLVLRPELILAGPYSEPRLLRSLRRLEIAVEQFPLTNTLQGIEADIRRLANLLGQVERGERLIMKMRANLARIETNQAHSTRPKALFYQPRGYSSGSHTLQDEALDYAGWRNLAAEAGIRGYAPLDLETLLLSEPDQLFTSGHTLSTFSRAQQLLHHPALHHLLQQRPILAVPLKYWLCAGPMIVEAIAILHAAHER
jgi:iron complex transport system substrate-binding protein